jgi:hypothetical protein
MELEHAVQWCMGDLLTPWGPIWASQIPVRVYGDCRDVGDIRDLHSLAPFAGLGTPRVAHALRALPRCLQGGLAMAVAARLLLWVAWGYQKLPGRGRKAWGMPLRWTSGKLHGRGPWLGPSTLHNTGEREWRGFPVSASQPAAEWQPLAGWQAARGTVLPVFAATFCTGLAE